MDKVQGEREEEEDGNLKRGEIIGEKMQMDFAGGKKTVGPGAAIIFIF